MDTGVAFEEFFCVRKAKWDWFQTSVMVPDPTILEGVIKSHYPECDMQPAAPKNGFTGAYKVAVGSRVYLTVEWGGNTGVVHLRATGVDAERLAQMLEKNSIPHLPTRQDAAIDFDEEGLFDGLSKMFIDYAKENSIAMDCQGDWQRGKGRTLYLGSRSSMCQLVIYEKGYEQGDSTRPNWVRVEARFYKAKGEKNRRRMSKLKPYELFQSRWIGDAIRGMRIWGELEKVQFDSVWRDADYERAKATMFTQYGKILESIMQESSGDFATFGEIIYKGLLKQREANEKRKATMK